MTPAAAQAFFPEALPEKMNCEGARIHNIIDTTAIDAYSLEKGQLFHRPNVGFTQTASVSVNLIGWWGKRHEKPIYLISNIINAYQACRYYRRRYRIETFFSDQKSRGFHIHKSHLADPDRLNRLLIATCLAYLWIVSQGIAVLTSKQTGLIDRTERLIKAFFDLAWTGSSMS